MRCPKCKEKLVPGAKFCHQCGAELSPELVEKVANWYHDPVFVLLMIFLVLAVFGLPLLWKSPQFKHWQKVAVSVVTVLYTGAIVWLLWYLVFALFLPYLHQIRSLL